jgi:hypothetical protein
MKIHYLIAAVLMAAAMTQATTITTTTPPEPIRPPPSRCGVLCTPFKCCDIRKNQPRCIGCYSNKCCKWQR